MRINFLNWQPDKEDVANEGLTRAVNVLHDTEGYKPLVKQTAGAFAASTFYAGATLSSVRDIHIRQVGMNANRVAALAQDRATTSAIADLSIGLEGEAGPFTTISSGTLVSAGGVRIASFSVAEMESGAFGVSALFDASLLAGGSTQLSVTGEVTYSVTETEDPASGSGSTSLEGTNAEHSQTLSNADVYAGLYLKNDGNEYAFSSSGTQEGTLLSAWLDSGSVDGMWAWASVTSGGLEVDAGTQAWLSLSESRAYGIKQATAGTATAAVEVQIATDSSGENVIDTANYTLTAIREGVSLFGPHSSHTRFRESATCSAGVSLNANGTEYSYSAAGVSTGTTVGTWLVAGAAADNYVRCTILSGTINGDDAGQGTWLQLNTTRSWEIERATAGTKATSIRLEIDTVGDGSNIVATDQYDLSANYTDLN